MRRRATLVPLLVCLALGLSAGCSDDDSSPPTQDGSAAKEDAAVQNDAKPHGDGGHNVDEEACEHLREGPFKPVTAATDVASAPPPAIAADHNGYQVSLTGGTAGFVRYDADAAGDHILFLDTDVAVELQDDQSQVIAPEDSVTSISECTEVKRKLTFDLDEVGRYFFKLGPTTADTTVTVVIEEAAHEEAGHND